MQEVSDEVVEVTVEKAAEARRRIRRKDAGEGLVKWESFLPKIALRILLIESDDSTRHIISALLRKCSYRVAAVADGLKAWEMLKANPKSVDLILTEIDLPSISGYALLSLIMEHEICKNIPVIMMSTEDSVNTVYKCMLKGATDFLLKPLRRNELRNLWQHVWRRQSSSCTKPEMEGERAENNPKDSLQLESANSIESSKEAIDFMEASLRSNEQCNREESIAKYEPQIELDLSLKRPNASESQSSRDRPSLHPSTASAFARYVHKPLETQCSVSHVSCVQRKNVSASQEDNILLSNQYNTSEPPPSDSRRHEASFYTKANSPGPPCSNQMNSWLGQSSYPSPILIKNTQFTASNTAYADKQNAVGHHFNTNHIDQQHLEKKNVDGYSFPVGKTQQSLQREAALNKFRLKRKDRCFEKKVRYERRKKLAEQRPRIKGQFVRQVQSTDTSRQTSN